MFFFIKPWTHLVSKCLKIVQDFIFLCCPRITLRYFQKVRSISKNQYTMQVFDGERLVKVYRIGTGRQDRTPVGKFVVTGKEKNPVWYPGGTPVAADDPRNPLGTRWMALKGTTPDTVHYRGYGIHGTKDPESIGKMESNGCIRMVNQQVENLYDYILPGVPVIIEE